MAVRRAYPRDQVRSLGLDVELRFQWNGSSPARGLDCGCENGSETVDRREQGVEVGRPREPVPDGRGGRRPWMAVWMGWWDGTVDVRFRC